MANNAAALPPYEVRSTPLMNSGVGQTQDTIVQRSEAIVDAGLSGFAKSGNTWTSDTSEHREANAARVHQSNLTLTRQLNAEVTDGQRAAVYRQHAALSRLIAFDEATAADRRQHAMLAWQIDRFEDAAVGPSLDAMEELTLRLEKLAAAVQSTTHEVKGSLLMKPVTKRRRKLPH